MSGSVIVVGGGVAGMTVAHRLALGGRAVTLVEQANVMGGQVRRHSVGGIDLDAGAESFATRGGAVAALAAELGLAGEIVAPAPLGAWLYGGGRAHPLPKTAMLGIPARPLAREVIAITGLPAAVRAQLDVLLPRTVGAESETLADLVRSRMGRGILERLVAPLTQGVHSASPEQLTLDAVAPGLMAALLREGSLVSAVRSMQPEADAGSTVAGFRGGITRLVEALARAIREAGVDVRTGQRAVELRPDGVRLPGGRIQGTVVLAAAPPGTPTTRVVLATLVVDDPRLDAAPRGTGLLVAPGSPDVRAKALTHASAKWPWLAQAADGRHVLRLSYREDHDDLAETALRDAGRLLGLRLGASSVQAFAKIVWDRPARTDAGAGMLRIGQTVAGTGLANTIAHARAFAENFLHASSGERS